MWISKYKYEEMVKDNRQILKQKAEKDIYIGQLEERLKESETRNALLENELANMKSTNSTQEYNIKNLNKDNNILLTANQKLTEWVNKIINEVGIYEVQDRRTIAIPIFKNPVKAMYGKMDDIRDHMEEFVQREEVIVPEIRFIRMK